MRIFGRYFPSFSFTLLCLLDFIIYFNGVLAARFSTVLIRREGKILCAGTLKDLQTVITAANCVNEGEIEKYKILLEKSEPYTVDIKSMTKHENTKGDRNNIVLLHLKHPAKKGQKAVRINGRLPTRVYDDKILREQPRCVIVTPMKDRDIEVDVLSNSQCARQLDRTLTDTQICVHRIKGQRKKCPIGIGNPIVCRIDEGKWVQIGIHLNDECSTNTMVATRVSNFRTWMRTAPRQKNKIDNKDGNDQTDETDEVDETDETDETDSNTNDSNENLPDNGGREDTVSPSRPCNSSEFRCGDGSCIPVSNVCDGNKDCPCGSEDESSCGCNLAGTEFVTGFLNNIGPEVPILYISAPEVAEVTVNIPFLSYTETRTITQAEKWTIDDTTIIIEEKNLNKGVHVTSDKPITVVAANSREFSYSTIDGTIVYPVECLSTDYLVEVQNHRFYKTSQYAIIGTQVTPTDVTIVNKKGKTFKASLGFLDTYFLQEKDLRGTTIQASDKVVVLSGSECGYVPSSMTASCDHLVNQIPPRSMFGNAYIIAQQKPRTGFSFRVQASEDDTTFVLRQSNGDTLETVTLNVGTEYVKFYLDSQPLSVQADKGVMVTQYALDAKIDDLGEGDPSMVVLQSLNSFDTSYNFVIPDHFLRVSITVYLSTCHEASGLRLDGEEVSTCGMTPVSIPGYGDYNVINIDLGTKWETVSFATLSHTERDVTFGAFLYGTRIEGAGAWRIGGKL